MRVFELSRELGTTSRYLISQLEANEIEVSSIWTDLDDEDVSSIKESFVHRPWDDVQAEERAALEAIREREATEQERRQAHHASETEALAAARKRAEEMEAATKAFIEPPPPEPEAPEAPEEPEAEQEAPERAEAAEAEAETEEKAPEAEPTAKEAEPPKASPEPEEPVAPPEKAEPTEVAVPTETVAPEEDKQADEEDQKPQPSEPESKPPAAKKRADGHESARMKKLGKTKDSKVRAAMRAAAAREAKAARPEKPEPEPEVPGEKTIALRGEDVLVKDLADRLRNRPNRVIAELMRMNVLASINQRIDMETAIKVAERFGFEVERTKGRGDKQSHSVIKTEESVSTLPDDNPEEMVERPPVVTFLGHVDHGKTSLMDYIRDAKVASGEAGGITQHIGSYTVEHDGQKITFLDTPGHAAFSAMRARGANLTDIAVIIIAADDGIMPQTKEAIKHAQNANVALMVAVNKCDLPSANPDRVRTQLQAEGLTPEEWGGDTICVNVSAQTGEGIDSLLEMILLQSEVLELRANEKRRANGYVIEAQMEAGRGPTASVLVTGGTLKNGDAMLCGEFFGKIKAMMDDKGETVNSAGPSIPVKVLGLSGVPEAGSEFIVLKSEKRAKALAAEAAEETKQRDLMSSKATTVDALMSKIKEQSQLELKVIIRADTQGSVEAIIDSLNEIESEKVTLAVIHSGTGNITVTDVQRAAAGEAMIVGFHVNSEPGVQSSARHSGTRVLTFRIIYELLDRLKNEMLNLIAPEYEEVVRGRAELRQVFTYNKRDRIAGCLVIKGTITNKCTARVIRGGEVVHEGPVASIRHFQDEVKEVREAQECGILLANYTEVEEGDVLEFFELQEKERTL